MKKKPKPIRDAFVFFMKVSLIHMIITCVSIMFGYALDTSGQEVLERKVTLQVENAKIKDVLTVLETEARVKFTYRPRVLKNVESVTIHATGQPLGDVLTSLFGESVEYEVI